MLAPVGAPGEVLPDATPENARLVAAFRDQAALSGGGRKPVERPPRPIRATPGARRLAREAGLALADVPRASEDDVLRKEDARRFLVQR